MLTIRTRGKLSSRGTMLDELVEILRKRIVDHDLPPGAKLREADLADEFDVSRPRVREAFGVLEERGLIERIPNRGAVVTRLEADEICSLFDVREVLEGLAVRLATEKVPPESWEDLIHIFEGPAALALADNDFDAYVECLGKFRERCIVAAGNPILSAQLDGLYDRTKVLIRRLLLVPGRASQGLSQHREVLRAMRAGDAYQAESLKRENIRSARECFLKYRKYLL